MTVTYTKTRHDLLTFQFHHFRRSPIIWLPYALVGVIFFLEAPEATLAARIVATMIFLILLLPILLAFYAAVLTLKLLLRKASHSPPGTVKLSDAGVQVKTATSCQDHLWAGIKKVRRTRRHLFIYLAASIACVVPRRAFANAEEWESFCELCLRQIIET